MKFIYTIIAFLATLPAIGQTIEGNIISADGKPVSNISIKLEGSAISTRTAPNGDFTLRHVTPVPFSAVHSFHSADY